MLDGGKVVVLATPANLALLKGLESSQVVFELPKLSFGGDVVWSVQLHPSLLNKGLGLLGHHISGDEIRVYVASFLGSVRIEEGDPALVLTATTADMVTAVEGRFANGLADLSADKPKPAKSDKPKRTKKSRQV